MKARIKHITHRYGLRLFFVTVALLLFWSQSGFVFWQVARTIAYQYHRTAALSKERDTLILTSEEVSTLVWVKKDEIRFNGRMFDVKRSLQQNGVTFLTGHYDTHDDKLFSFLSRLFSEHENQKQGKHKFVFWFCEALLTSVVLPGHQCFSDPPVFHRLVSDLCSVIICSSSPPPRGC